MKKLITSGYRSLSASAISSTLDPSLSVGTVIPTTSSVIAIANTPSLNARTRPNSTLSRA
jgi:hypothetical protein